MTVYVSGAVEGIIDEAVFGRLVQHAKAEVGPIHRTEGKGRLLARLNGFNHAARHAPWFVLVDLNGDADCAPSFVHEHLPSPAPRMAFRVAVRAIEAWLLADRERMAAWLDVPLQQVPGVPDTEADPKAALINLARRSRSWEVRADLVPREGSGRKAGPLYPSRLIEFVQGERHGWRPAVAARTSDSLRRCLRHLRNLATPIRGGPA
ncbi:MAG TPA: hypothetical protein VGS03_13225 [Candidatus Polarisedimenticolia bacterium]|jgi:hypothetical protein|nr:hypothetical protein [Candidatus Polarisedimenticolia bacterium]